MNKSRGFTLIELMIVVAIVAIIAAIIAPAFTGKRDAGPSPNNQPEPVAAGVVDGIKCVDGLMMIVQDDAAPKQVVDQKGKGVPCTTQAKP